ncbi:STAS-like domain-containing protein [Planctomycetota bacterium]
MKVSSVALTIPAPKLTFMATLVYDYGMANKNVSDVIREIVAERGVVTNREVADITGLSRQAVHRHFRKLVDDGELMREGAGRGTRYRPSLEGRWCFRYPRVGLEEDRVWSELCSRLPAFGDLEGEPRHVLAYAFTEMLNNAIDHSGSEEVAVIGERSGNTVGFEVVDGGVGVYDSIRTRFKLPSRLAALQELSKGKVTTQPARHSGEGIFFVSKVASRFELESGGVVWQVDNVREDMAVGGSPPRRGTRVRFELDLDRVQPLAGLFEAYTEDFAFTRTRTYVRLFAVGTTFVSRSEAKRLTSGLDRFDEVVLDFAGVEAVGQGFLDEIFRVWATAHLSVSLIPVHMVEPVAFMVARAQQSATRDGA